MNHQNFKQGEKVRIKNIGPEIDGKVVTIVGVAMRHVVDTYIVQLPAGELIEVSDDYFSCFNVPEGCLERL